MVLPRFLAELKHRNVYRAAVVYAVVGWALLEAADVVLPRLGLPDWAVNVVLAVVLLCFPLALVFAWIFDLNTKGIVRTQPMSSEAHHRLSITAIIEFSLICVLVITVGYLYVDRLSLRERFIDLESSVSNNTSDPVVILMDTFASKGVYDQETRSKSGTNADVLSDVLQELPIITQKETIGSDWDREDQLLKHNPSLVLIHRSAFFHSMNEELEFGYPDNPASYREEDWKRLYEIADNKLVAFLGYISLGNPSTKFVVYSRGTGGEWADKEFRADWVQKAEGRFPSLKGRITAINIPGGVAGGSFRNPGTALLIKELVEELVWSEPTVDN
ncbi:MAG: hypothetical protein P8Y96_13040 [Desulfuromonadales bacterium]